MTLLALIREHSDVLEADVQRYYRIDLAGLWRGELSLRRAWVLIRGLPAEAASMKRMSGVEPESPLMTLDYADVVLARVADELAALRWQWEAAHTDPKRTHRLRKPPASVLPELGPRPDAEAAPAQVVSPHQLGAFVAPTEDDEEATDGD